MYLTELVILIKHVLRVKHCIFLVKYIDLTAVSLRIVTLCDQPCFGCFGHRVSKANQVSTEVP